MIRNTAVALLLAFAALTFSSLVYAQAPTMYDPRDAEYRLLGLIRAKADYEQALAEHQRAEREHAEGLISLSRLDAVRQRMETTRVNYLQQSLAVIFEQPHVLIDRALKYQDADGNKFVRLTLRNTAASAFEADTLAELIDVEILDLLEPDRVRSVFISLKSQPGQVGAIISSPYEIRIDELAFNEPETVTFRLLQDADEVTVSVSYAGVLDEKTVYLEKDATANIVNVESTQFSQEADLGGQATFDLALEQFTDEANTFRLAAVGLPPDIRYEFGDPTSGARLTQVRFPVGVSQRSLTLTLSLPQRAGGSLPQAALDRPLPFYALVMNEEAAGALAARLQQAGTLEADSPELMSIVGDLDAGMVRLEVIPRGIGRVEMRAPNLYHEIFPGDQVSMEVTLRNIGSRRLDSLRLLTETPLGWQGSVVPDLVSALEVDGDTVVQLTFSPPEDVPVGDYQMRIRAESAAAERRVESQETTVRVHVAAPANLWLTGTLALLLIFLVAGIVIFGIKLTSR